MTKTPEQKLRLGNPAWLREQIRLLATEAEDNAAEDEKNAENDHHEREKYEARAQTAAHYGAQLRRILTGKTWEEAFRDAVKGSR